jgi:hypothetical protein
LEEVSQENFKTAGINRSPIPPRAWVSMSIVLRIEADMTQSVSAIADSSSPGVASAGDPNGH